MSFASGKPRRRARRIFARAGATLAATLLAATGFGLPALLAWDAAHGNPISPVAALLAGFPCLAFGLLGLDLALRVPRGTPFGAGFLRRYLARLSWLRPATVTLGVPLGCGALIALASATHDVEGLTLAECLGAAWFAYVVNVAIHELGHLLAVLLIGGSPIRVVILPFDFFRGTAGGWHARLCQEWFVVSGGLVKWQAQPPAGPRQKIVFAGAGPLASLLLLLLYLGMNPYPWPDLFAFWPGPVLILVGSFAALVTFLGNLIPTRSDPMTGYPSDGYVIGQNLALLRRPGPAAPRASD